MSLNHISEIKYEIARLNERGRQLCDDIDPERARQLLVQCEWLADQLRNYLFKRRGDF